ncbi:MULTISPECIES: VanZ family protein [Bhargavaea]|uniref:VanZ family protein n=1 Tax=Bhargavaea changchunensis TaxID=2134037 RepID=A0ABW2NFC9_9BACL|nr:VanZ family protein [Bhargavaea sp. CC-171006]
MNEERNSSLPIYALLWAAVIIIATCTSDPRTFLFEAKVSYHIEFAPNFYELLITSDFNFNSKFYLVQKIGHFLSFGLLYVLLLTWIKRLGKAFVLCGLFALLTEVLQLFFGRNGRLYDVGIDLLGILLAYLICSYIKLATDARLAR